MARTITKELIRIVSGHIRGYDVIITGDVVAVINEGCVITKQVVPGLSRFIKRARDFKLGWAMLGQVLDLL